MFDDAYPPARPVRRARRRRLRGDLLVMTAAAAIVVGALPRFSANQDVSSLPPPAEPAPSASRAAVPAPTGRYAWMLDPTPALGSAVGSLHQGPALGSAFAPPAKRPIVIVASLAEPEIVETPQSKPVRQTERFVQTVPLPMPRPTEFRRPAAAAVARLADRPVPPRTAAPADESERSFFETVFGAARPATTGPALAYASVDTESLGLPRRSGRSAPQVGAGTAVYDISANRVTLPNGEVLEAHSGLGRSMDEPRDVHLKMRGSTPPGTYDLTEREALFHGVRAIRLNPVGGSGSIFGRAGLLAHTYMLGPSGASNGCVSFRNYNRFLQAYLRGEVRRLVVVAGSKGDRTPSFASRLFGASASAE